MVLLLVEKLNDYPAAGLDIQPKIEEFRIVESTGGDVGITSIKAGDGLTSSTIITVTTSEPFDGILWILLSKLMELVPMDMMVSMLLVIS